MTTQDRLAALNITLVMLSIRLRATVYTLVIPGFLIGYVPWKLRHFEAVTPPPFALIFSMIGIVLCLGGGVLIFSAAYYLVRRGDGTPFPLDPPQRMVVAGPYAHIRHPMVVGLLGVLCGQAVWFQSANVLAYTLLLLLVSLVYVFYIEEPDLKKRFGADYRAYHAVTPRWFPSRVAPNQRNLPNLKNSPDQTNQD